MAMTGRLIRLPDDLWDRIDEIAEKDGRTRSNWIRQRLTEWAEDPSPTPQPAAESKVAEPSARITPTAARVQPPPAAPPKKGPTRQKRKAQISPKDCVHPPNFRLGDGCGLCGKDKA